MTHVQLFTGTVRPLPASGRPTGMYKQALREPMHIGSDGLVGDEQADRRVHGGPEKALHSYPARHYARLAQKFPLAAQQLVPGAIGENLSSDELDEADVRVGEVWSLGDALLQVCQPRNPCWKIDERFGCEGMAAFIVEQRITGWYWRVLREGLVRPGDALERRHTPPAAPTLRDALEVWHTHPGSPALLLQLAGAEGIAEAWKAKLRQRADWLLARAR